MATRVSTSRIEGPQREVLEFDLGVRAYLPSKQGGYWRIRWEEEHKPRDTSART